MITENKECVNIQTKEKLDMKIVDKLKDNAMLKHRIELFNEWNFKKNDELGLDIYKMTKGSDKKVWWHCSGCEQDYYSTIHPRVKGVGCPYCRGLLASEINNLEKDNPHLSSEWHPTKNGNLTPKTMTKMSGQKVWWLGKCSHEWEATISDRAGRNRGCPYCCHNPKVLIGFNDMLTTHPHLINILYNKEDGHLYTYGSTKKIKWKCDVCENILSKKITEVVKRGLSCPRCSDGISFGEKAMYHLLVDNQIDFIYDSTTSWSGSKRYDFYIPSNQIIVEIMGEQHSETATGNFSSDNSLEDVVKNDEFKYNLALSKGIKKYYSIDIKDRDISYFSNSKDMSELLMTLGILSVDWVSLAIKSHKSMVASVCENYEQSNLTSGDLSELYKLSQHTIIRYLKLGNELGLCEYTPNDKRSKERALKKQYKKVVQFDLNGNYIKTFESVKEATIAMGDSPTVGSIASCCRNLNVSAYGYMWRYYSDIGEVKTITPYRRKDNVYVVQLTLNNELIKIHNTLTDAMNESGSSNISKVCKGQYSQSGGFKWMYKEDYDKMIKNK